MKTTKFKIVVFLMFLLTHVSIYAQYSGGNSDGSSSETLSVTSCPMPAHFYAYFGGSQDGSSVDLLMNATCSSPPHFFAYMGGSGDGEGVETIETTTCGTPNHFFAYMGGSGDGESVETIENTTCAFPPQFYAYFGGQGDGFSMDKTAPICPTEPPVASFTASATTICVGQSVTFTDTSTNIPAGWTWTFAGGTPATSIVQNPVITYNTPGVYNVTLVAANYNGTDTIVATGYITVYAYPVVTSVTPASRCDSGTVTLQATTNVGALNWYDAPTGGNLVGTGTSFTTPSLTSTTTYYVESLNGVCSSSRSSVVATVNATPSITSTTPATRCGAGSVTIQATASAGTIYWYDAPTGGTLLAAGTSFSPSVTTTTTYYVETTLNSCTSPRTPVIVTVNAVPTITSTTPASRCDSGSVTLQASASSGTLNWYDAPTGGTLLGSGTSFATPTISTSTYYYVESANGTCNSPRTAVLATVNATPSITSTTPSQVCDSGTVTLSATANAGVLNWYNVPTGGSVLGTGNTFTTPSITTTTTYYVEAVNTSCISVRVPVVATVNVTPSITTTTGATVCGNSGATLYATASAGTIYWYFNASGGSPIASGPSVPVSGGSWTFYAEVVDNGCVSPRIPVVYTNIPLPNITSITPATQCGSGSMTLGATADSGTISWYDAPTGGNLVATGTSYTTPVLSSTTTYYVESTNGSCTSSTRTAVTATISVTNPPIATANQTFCASEIVGYIAVIPSGPSIIWYDAPTGGNVVPNNTALVSGTTYYASQTISGCESTVRTPVTMTLGACLATEEFDVNTIQLYPNPVIDIVTVSSSEMMTKIEIVNMLGQMVYSNTIKETETQLDMTRYASGSYIIRVLTDDKVKTFKVIKK